MNIALERKTPGTEKSVSRGRGGIRRLWKEHGFGYMLLMPVVLYILIFQFYPLLETVRLSFYNYSLMNKKQGITFAGLDNYTQLLFNDEHFWQIFNNSLVWVLGSTLLQFVIAVPAALIMNQKLRARGLWRGLMMVPWVSPVVIIGIIWKWIYDGQYGLANDYLKVLHVIQENIVWLGSEFWVWPALLLTATWKGFPYVTLMLLSGLQGISSDLKEAAHIDGATAWQRFIYVILPLLKPIMYVTGLVSIIASWTKFEMIWILTNGGPGYSTGILPTYLYTNAFVYFDLGKGSAIATLSMVLVLIIVVVYAKLFGKENM
ncbi:ABC transporter permease subunit [Paenibacillus sp. LMG 31456]|uniref:ABC transporter permease subunit n=1 Tax=Paenibacillus foliorum TaxID=2654974 RepID=A0A972JXP1_9BACL|nr:sugar ABC transporter permease [Paenibacillus foliorum]NOU91701.1 ABC transporter permease subunit [Paenibacillus foliorum]